MNIVALVNRLLGRAPTQGPSLGRNDKAQERAHELARNRLDRQAVRLRVLDTQLDTLFSSGQRKRK